MPISRKSTKKDIILITSLDVWMLTGSVKKSGMGNQSLYNTLLGYANHGYNVHMLTTSMGLKNIPPIHPNVHVYRFTIKSYEFLMKLKQVFLDLLGLAIGKSHQAMSTTVRVKPVRQSLRLVLHSYIFAWAMARNARRLLKNLNVAFVYGHEILGALAASRLCRKVKLPLITRFQGTELGQFLDDSDVLLSYTANVRALRAPADLVIMANDGTQGDKVLDLVGVPKENYRFYMNGVVKDEVYRPDVDVSQMRKKASIPAENLFLLYKGRFFYWKRIDRLLKVFAKVLVQYPKMTLVFIGDGPEKKACENLVNGLGIMNNVAFLGPLPHFEVMDYLNACDIYVAFHDLTNLCNPIIEACVCGKCIVTRDIGGTDNLLTHNKNALMPDTSDEEKLAQSLLFVATDESLRDKLAKAAFERGAELNTWEERMVMEVAEVESVLAKKQ
jgi:glycosyltransferase involved in cell wall biosynthesis